MAAPITRGILVSLENTPQAAGDDFYGAPSTGLTEDSGVVYLDVMANDLGGAAKTLYALDDADSEGGDRPVDLLTQDAVGSVNHSSGGAEIWITSDGKVAYMPGSAFQHLPAGETFTDTFTYAIRLGDGTISWATATVQIIGVDDQPTLAAVTAGSVAEVDQSASTTDSGLSGTLAGADVDDGETLTYGIQSGAAGVDPNTVVKAGTYGTLTVNTLSGAYSYAKNAAAIEALDATEGGSDVFTVTVSDGDGPLVTQTYTVSVSGADDAPTLGAVTSGSVAEVDQSAATNDAGLSGLLVGADVDVETLTYGIQSGAAGVDPNTVVKVGTFGTLTVNTVSGAYSYAKNAAAIEALDATEGGSDVFTMTVSDGDGPLVTQSYTVNVNGADDAPTLGAVTSGSVAEVDQSAATTDSGLSGTLIGADVDVETLTYGIQDGAAGVDPNTVVKAGTYGTLTVNTVSGAYSYAKNAAAIEALDATEGDSDVFTMTVSDGDGPLVTQSYTVNVTGAADGPTIASLPTAFTGADPNDNDNAGLGPVDSAGVGTGGGDVLRGTTGADTINGGDGNDDIFGYGGNDIINGGANNDDLYGGAGDDTINGDINNDTIYGGSGNDTIHGNANVDTIYGGSGDDIIFGDDNADTIIGGYGADTMNGGAGADTFRFLDVKDTNDTITGFVSGSDELDLSAINSGALGGVFGWGGQQTGATVEAHGVTWYTSGSDVVVLADIDGNVATAEFMITLTGITSIAEGDFVL